jgi:predicted membrane protein
MFILGKIMTKKGNKDVAFGIGTIVFYVFFGGIGVALMGTAIGIPLVAIGIYFIIRGLWKKGND